MTLPLQTDNTALAKPGRPLLDFRNRNFVRGIFMIAIALLFGVFALEYNIGQLSRSGAGMFPFMVSSFLLLIGVLSVIRSYFVEPVLLSYNFKNIALILAGLCGLAAISQFLNMILGIIFMVFVITFAGTSYSVVRNIKISIGLIAIAFAFKNFLGLSLPLY
jgi:predicted MFS family arabinose efflux permease